jgi:mono/diheme cytochrome c family protein
VLRNLPASLRSQPPQVSASTLTARAALGYLHGNCGHCHNASGPLAEVGLHLAQPAPVRLPADPKLLVAKMRSPNPLMRMPPLGVRQPDAEGIALIERWIRNELSTTTKEEHRP